MCLSLMESSRSLRIHILFAFYKIKVSDKTDHKVMRVGVTFQIVYFRLLDIAQIAYTKNRFLDRNVKCQKLT